MSDTRALDMAVRLLFVGVPSARTIGTHDFAACDDDKCSGEKSMRRMIVRNMKKPMRVGSSFGLLGCGLLLFFAPGPNWFVIMTALSVMAADFLWAKKVRAYTKNFVSRLRAAVFGDAHPHELHHPLCGH
jgi:hypothetical protein